MRLAVKKRLTFFIIAITIYTIGFNFLPEEFNFDGSLNSLLPVLLASFGYFILIPALHWVLIIKANQDKAWKLFIILSISCTCARYSYPAALAEYFEFIAWLRYPIIAVLLLIELYLMYIIVKGLWSARKLSGDPRVNVIEKYKDDEKKLSMALTFSWEPATWYYAIPRFTRKHVNKAADLSLASSSLLHCITLVIICIFFSGLSYELLNSWSELTAIIVSSVILYSVPFIIANHRVAKNYSIYIHNNKLIVNNSFWGVLAVELQNISGVEVGIFDKTSNKELLKLGRGEQANLKLSFDQQQTYFGSVATFPEKIEQVLLTVEAPKELEAILQEKINLVKAG